MNQIYMRKTHTKTIVIALLSLTISLSSQAQQKVGLQEAVKWALENNLQVKQAAFQESLSEQTLRQSKMDLYPTVNGSINGNLRRGLFFDQTAGALLLRQNVNTADASVFANALIFSGFQRLNQIRANKYQLLADKTNLERVKNDLVLTAVTTYLEALTNLDLFTASKQQLELSQQQLEVEEASFEVGNRTVADLSQARSQMATDDLSVTSAENAYQLSILDLKQLMEMDPATEIVLVKPELPDVEDLVTSYKAEGVFQEAIKSYPDIKQAEFDTDVALKNIAVARGGYYPQLSLTAGMNTSYSSAARDFETARFISFGNQLDRNTLQFVGFTLNIPVFNGFTTRINVKRAQITFQNTQTAEQLAKNNLNKVINQAVLDLRSAERRYYSTESAFESAKDAFDVIKQRYEVGLANAIEQSTAQTTMNRAEFEFIQARYDLIFRSKVIDFYLGREMSFNQEQR